MLLTSKEQHIEFLQTQLILPVRKVVDDDQVIFGFMIMSQAIEILGAYFDDKPFRAKQQSLKRFCLAINKLFPDDYYRANKKGFMYYQLRACLTHMFIPTFRLSLNAGKQTKEKPHLNVSNEVMFLYLEDLFRDFNKAVEKLIQLIMTDKIKLKPISTGNINYNSN
ncbi:MAG TPA: hypothetical protein PLL66_05435 [Bacteroidales bacterium]|nr:hypothetical protein [Bacteroidales bacterium]